MTPWVKQSSSVQPSSPSIVMTRVTGNMQNDVITIQYRLIPCRPLPAFDPIPSIKQTILHPAAIKVYNVIYFASQPILIPLYCVATCLRLGSFFAPTCHTASSSLSVAEILALTASITQAPLFFIAFMGMRREFVKVLVQSFEFWFLSTTSILMLTALGLANGWSVRLLTLPYLLIDVIIGLFSESYLTMQAAYALASGTMLVSVLILMSGVTLNLTTGLDLDKTIMVFEQTHFVLSTRDVLLNTMGTVALFYARVVFLSVYVNRKGPHDGTVVASIIVRCPLAWDLCLQPNSLSASSATTSNVRSCNNTITTVTPLSAMNRINSRCLTMTAEIDKELNSIRASNLVLPNAQAMFRNAERILPIILMVLGCVGNAGAGFTLMATPPLMQEAHHDKHANHQEQSGDFPFFALSAIGFWATFTYATIVVACYERKMLKQLFTTFNVVFLSLQVSIAHLCLCDSFSWQSDKVLSATACWIWLHLVLTTDALTPVIKTRLGLKVWYAIPVVAAALVSQVILMLELVWWDHWEIPNHTVLRIPTRSDQEIVFRSSSVLLGRLVTMVVWFSRILLRIWRRRHDDELIFIQGRAAFDYVKWKLQRALESYPAAQVDLHRELTHR